MVPNWLAIIPYLSIRSLGDLSVQPELARNHRLGEIAFADEVRDDGNVLDCLRIKKKNRVAQARLFFPKRALHISENISPPDLSRMRQRRRARIRIHRRAVTDNQ